MEDTQPARGAGQRLSEVVRQRLGGVNGQAGSISKLRSIAGAECVNAPTDT
jgi:hypothetical protein